jgi:hypothetical protein
LTPRISRLEKTSCWTGQEIRANQFNQARVHFTCPDAACLVFVFVIVVRFLSALLLQPTT